MKIIICDTFFKKLVGFSNKKNFDYAIKLTNTRSIHTFFMKKTIDVYMTDKNNKILEIHNNIKKYKIIIGNKNIVHTYEFPSGNYKYKVNDIIKD